MTAPMSLLEFLQELLTNVSLRDYVAEEPERALEEYGLSDLSPADVCDALVLIQDNQTADFSRDYSTGANTVSYIPPVPTGYSGGDHKAAVEYLNSYITHNYVDDRDTITDSSVNQQVDTDGGDFDQYIDIDSTVASGDGAVAAGDDITGSTVVTGNGNQVGDGNVSGTDNIVGDDNEVLQGDDTTAAFGSGDAASAEFDDVTVDDGGALAAGGNADGDNDVRDSNNTSEITSTTTTTTTGSGNVDLVNNQDSNNETSSSETTDSNDDIETHVGSHNRVEVDVIDA